MPPPKKAAKKSPPHHAKKSPSHPHDDHKHGKDLRRAHEHLSRVEILQRIGKSGEAIQILAKLAQQQLKSEHNKD